ncbi:hypothetical protein CH063_05494 [Colletotrichum higginsianum]|uniref:Zn(2)-C6 fungal-type domain-containing protein n=1 Tax=Colletotrichum higginsianum (strain IMI 349063) TaxID=759273 RepID=H1UZ74_COLHI|nr:hypothetical protein CH063_05494 [Colletotrichum higginsianum]
MKIRNTNICQNCRVRKLACDGKIPACSQCDRTGRTCPGYQSSLIFRPPVVPRHHQPAPMQPRRSRVVGGRQQPRQQTYPTTSTEEAGPSQAVHQVSKTTVHMCLNWPLMDIISLVVQNLCPIEILNRTDLSSSNAGGSVPRICGAWVEALPELVLHTKAEQILSPSIKTLALAILSRGRESRMSTSDAVAAHAHAVSSLRSGFLQENVSDSSNLLAATVMCLFLSEMILPTSKAAAIVHAKGIGDVLKLQSPGFYTHGIGHKLFVGIRPVLVLHSFFSHELSFLAEDVWKHEPFSGQGAAPLQELFSIVVALPSALSTIDKLKVTLTEQSYVTACNALDQLTDTLNGLLNLRQTIQDESQREYWAPALPPNIQSGISFQSITAANFFTHLWAFHIICAGYIKTLLTLFPACLDRVHQNLKRQISRDLVTDLACRILRSIEFLADEKFKRRRETEQGAAVLVSPCTADILQERLSFRKYACF